MDIDIGPDSDRKLCSCLLFDELIEIITDPRDLGFIDAATRRRFARKNLPRRRPRPTTRAGRSQRSAETLRRQRESYKKPENLPATFNDC